MKRIRTSKPGGLSRYALIVYALIVGTPGVGSAIAADNNAKVTLVYEHALPNVPGKSIKGVLVEYGPGGSSPTHTHPKSAFIYASAASLTRFRAESERTTRTEQTCAANGSEQSVKLSSYYYSLKSGRRPRRRHNRRSRPASLIYCHI